MVTFWFGHREETREFGTSLVKTPDRTRWVFRSNKYIIYKNMGGLHTHHGSHNCRFGLNPIPIQDEETSLMLLEEQSKNTSVILYHFVVCEISICLYPKIMTEMMKNRSIGNSFDKLYKVRQILCICKGSSVLHLD